MKKMSETSEEIEDEGTAEEVDSNFRAAWDRMHV